MLAAVFFLFNAVKVYIWAPRMANSDVLPESLVIIHPHLSAENLQTI